MLTLFGTASKMMAIESLIMVQVVIMTIIENTNVHSGSAILAFGWKIYNVHNYKTFHKKHLKNIHVQKKGKTYIILNNYC